MRLRLSRPGARRAPPGGLLAALVRMVDALSARRRAGAPHLATGRRGEELAFWFLRQRGYTIVARNYRQATHAGELDLIAYEGGVLVFVEVKTRSREGGIPAELAVDRAKRAHMARLARAYRRRRGLPDAPGAYRFDLVIVYEPYAAKPRITLHRDAVLEG